MFIRIGMVLMGLFINQAFAAQTTTTSPTTLNLQTQGRNPDFSSFPFTRPVSVGTALPASCQVGQLFFNSAATAGSNLYACTAANTWTLESAPPSTPGVTMASQLGDFAPTLSNGTLTIGANCSGTTPCNVRVGTAVYRFTNPATVTPSGSASGMAFGYIDGAGNLVIGGVPTFTCNGCTYASGITAFPAGAVPLFTWTLTFGSFDVGGGTDFRAFLVRKNLQSGAGILITESAGVSSIAADPSLVSLRVLTPPTASSSSCTAGQFSFDSTYYYLCTGANTWKRVTLSSF
jgi:hypothetical protein